MDSELRLSLAAELGYLLTRSFEQTMGVLGLGVHFSGVGVIATVPSFNPEGEGDGLGW